MVIRYKPCKYPCIAPSCHLCELSTMVDTEKEKLDTLRNFFKYITDDDRELLMEIIKEKEKDSEST